MVWREREVGTEGGECSFDRKSYAVDYALWFYNIFWNVSFDHVPCTGDWGHRYRVHECPLFLGWSFCDMELLFVCLEERVRA